jgi:hypothetical protein
VVKDCSSWRAILRLGNHTPRERHLRFVQKLMTYRYDRRWPPPVPAPAVLPSAVITDREPQALGFYPPAAGDGVARGQQRFSSRIECSTKLTSCAPPGRQRDVASKAYYPSRGAELLRPLVAYQLNWKGENFYSGNNMAIFIASSALILPRGAPGAQQAHGVPVTDAGA